MSHPTDPHPVRPGTSAALTARTIDATIHPPLVRAQEAVAEYAPRLAAPLSSPLLLASLVGTLVLWWLARRARFRPSGILLSAALLVTLSSFRPVGDFDGPGVVDPNVVEPTDGAPDATEEFDVPAYSAPMPMPDRSPYYVEIPETPEPPAPPSPMWHVRVPRVGRHVPPQLIEAYPGLVIISQLRAQQLVHDERQLRAYVKELNRRLRAEARRRARDWEEMSEDYARR